MVRADGSSSVLFVAIDIRLTPEATVMKWGFVLVTIYTGPSSARFYTCLVAASRYPTCTNNMSLRRGGRRLGSTMHCVAGDGVGILVAPLLPLRSDSPDLLMSHLSTCLGIRVRTADLSGAIHARPSRRFVREVR